MKKLWMVCLACLGFINAMAQETEYRRCDTDQMWKSAVEQDPKAAERNASLKAFREIFAKSARQYNGNASPNTVLYRIPVVFHIIHTYGNENISKAQVEDAVRILNLSFQKLNPDTGMVIPLFQPIFANPQIELVLANIDPNGMCTDGITRTYSPLTDIASDNVKALVDWPSDQYFNVWVVKNIASGAAGYAYYPGINAAIDGVVMRHDYTGSIGTSSSSNYTERSLTHEVGHWLDLPHTWGSSNTPGDPSNCNIDDGIFDTPNTIGVDNFSCNTAQVTCSTVDNVQNYMDYASCHYMFTEGQKAAMHAALNSSVGNRDNLWQTANLLATGTEVGHNVSECKPVADFNQKVQYACQNSSIAFRDVSWGGPVASRTWYFPGGNPATDTSATPVVSYANPGVYDVKLVVSNINGTDSITRTSLVRILPSPGVNPIPYAEGFESMTLSNAGWSVENPDNNGTWNTTTVAAATGTSALRLVNQSGNGTGSIDAVITPTLNVSGVSGALLSFKYAYAAKNNNDSSIFRVYVSNNCGLTWILRLSKAGANLRTAPNTTGAFAPNATQWVTQTVNLVTTLFSGQPSALVKFEFNNDLANNFYIDDINISGATATNEVLAEQFGFNAFPNPAKEKMNVELQLTENSLLRFDILDLSGRLISSEEVKANAGLLRRELNGEELEGVYLLRVTINDQRFTRRISFIR
jgi:PKD repeat protein